MRDRLFSGHDVSEALRAAALALGVPESSLRYVVLDRGTAGERGLKPTPAQVAVLMSDVPPPSPDAVLAARVADPRARILAVVRSLADAAGLDVEVEIEEDDRAVVVHLGGADEAFFFGPGDRGEVLKALEHLLQRSLGPALEERILRLRCRGLEERRNVSLGEDARRLAAEVRADGTARSTEPLNSYERRIVHLALHGEPGVTTYSVGEGAERRVTIAPAPAPADPEPA